MICGWRVGRPNLGNLENLDCTEDLTSTVSQTTLQVSLGGQISQTSKYSFATSYILSFLQFCYILTRSFSNSFTFHHVLSFQTFPVVSPSSPVLNSNHITWQNKTVMQRLIWGNPTTLPLRWEATPPTEIGWKSWGITDQFSQNYFPLWSLLFTFIFTPNSRVKHSKTLACYICLFSLRLA